MAAIFLELGSTLILGYDGKEEFEIDNPRTIAVEPSLDFEGVVETAEGHKFGFRNIVMNRRFESGKFILSIDLGPKKTSQQIVSNK